MGSKINSLDDDTSLGGTYLNLRAEGNLCYLKGKYYDAIEYFTRALELRYTDCDVFIRRGWCHLQLCNTKVALKDVEHAHTHVTPQHAGRVVFLRAEVLYTMGEFEQALVYFNRGRTQNPSEHKFVLGINKCREAITNCVGAPERIKLSLQGDLTYFKNLDENKKLRAAQGARTHMSASTTFNKYLKEQVASEKTIQQLLAQIYDDKVFLEKLIAEAGRKMQYDDITVTLLTETLLYLKHRSLFWQKQNPIYSRRHDKLMRDRRRLCAVNNSNYLDKYLSKELEKVQNDIGNGHLSPGLRRASRCLNMLKNMDKDVPINRLLKDYAAEIAPVLMLIYQASLDQCTVPIDRKHAWVIPVYKKGDRGSPSNYRLIFLTSISCKTLEHIIHSNFMDHLENLSILTDYQHGFRKRRSCETQLIQTVDDLAKSLHDAGQIDAVLLDFSKAFNKVSLAAKLYHYSLRGNTLDWIQSFLSNRTQEVVLEGKRSFTAAVTSGVPQGTVLGPILFLCYINDLPGQVSSTAHLFADDRLLYRDINTTAQADKLQDDIDRLQKWEADWFMEFNPDKCETIRITNRRKKKVVRCYSIHWKALKEVAGAKYLGVTIDMKLT
ncbi:Tetratricopeptide repeat protein 25 [Lamellibrachia satsuma]|nr:Tetratricopeptide repeat protein 25 [Lamellibrachia satsuma]